MTKTLVIVLSETRAHELTFSSFKKNVVDELQADVCLCIGVKPDYDYNNPFYQLAKYKFLYNEPDDFGIAFEEAYQSLSKEKPTNEQGLHWREFLKIKNQFLGGIQDNENEHPGSAGILIFFRWFLLKNLYEHDLINQYDRFVITRSDFIYQLPHPQMELLNKHYIWIPNEEHYGGYTDRHVVLSKQNIPSYLNILNNLVLRSHEYFTKMQTKQDWNLEQLIKFHLEQNNVLDLVKEFPYIMYSVRNHHGSTRWSQGTYSEDQGYYIKYHREWDKSTHYKHEFETSQDTLDAFYKKHIKYADSIIPLIGLGVGGLDYASTYNAVRNALQLGYRLIDTAESYQNEDAVGNAIFDSGIKRNEITIISKYIGHESFGHPDDVAIRLNETLRKLKTSYLDVYLIHTPCACYWDNGWKPIHENKFRNYVDRLRVWLQMNELKRKHLVHSIGISNWTLENIEELRWNDLPLPDILQIEWCPHFKDMQLYDYCHQHFIKMIGYGLFSRNDIQSVDLQEKNKSLYEILIQWCIQRNITVIPRSQDINNMKSNLDAVNNSWTLCEEDMKWIDGIPQKTKGHCLQLLHEKNEKDIVKHWTPLVICHSQLQTEQQVKHDKIGKLVSGDVSCIIVKNIYTQEECQQILNQLENKKLIKNQVPFDNHGIHFRGNEIGITIDNMNWRENPRFFL